MKKQNAATNRKNQNQWATVGVWAVALLLGSGSASVRAAEKGTRTVKITASAAIEASATNAPCSDLESSINELERSIDEALQRYTKLAASDDERVKQFDAMLARIQKAVDLTAPDGSLEQKVELVLKIQREKVRYYTDKQKDDSIKEEHHIKYAQLASRNQATVTATVESLKKLGNIRDELTRTMVDVTKEKDFYIDLLQAKDFEEANKSLLRVGEAMRRVQGLIGGLGPIIREVVIQTMPAQG